jgi:hypothetical protein
MRSINVMLQLHTCVAQEIFTKVFHCHLLFAIYNQLVQPKRNMSPFLVLAFLPSLISSYGSFLAHDKL